MAPITSDTEIRLNAWRGDHSPVGDPNSGRRAWGLFPRIAAEGFLRPPAPVDLRDWRNPQVGWGLVLPDDDALDPKALAAGEDAPPPLKALLAARGDAPVLRYREGLHDGYLRRYYGDGSFADLSVAASKRGVDRHHVPRYLLIYASPEQIPWRTQYVLNLTAFTGRLWFDDQTALERYASRLVDAWSGAQANARAPVVWTVDHGKPDISWLMRGALADPIWAKLKADVDLQSGVRLGEVDATAAKLAAALAEKKPGFVLTTSHGATPYLSPADKVKADLGLLVDVDHSLLRPETALAGWEPDGAIWYSHACCSAGSDAGSRYKELFSAGDPVGELLTGVADKAGAVIAPLPMALLSAPKPLAAWVGHVEPTFDWTLRDPTNTQVLSSALVNALYAELYTKGTPIGFAVREVFQEAGQFLALWQQAVADVNAGDSSGIDRARYRQLVAMDRQNLVILGDPTVALPPF